MYTASSLEDFLFTPGELIKIRRLCETRARFAYTAANEFSPTVIRMHCLISHNQLANYMYEHQFQQRNSRTYEKDRSEVHLADINSGMVETIVFIKHE